MTKVIDQTPLSVAEEQRLLQLLLLLEKNQEKTWVKLQKIVKNRQFLRDNQEYFKKTQLAAAYKKLAGSQGLQNFNQEFYEKLLLKPVRTISGVAPVTVLTKPYPCPGNCIFCPNDLRMPKSYIAEEPGAQRAERNFFDPYLQVYSRLSALQQMGHSVDKVELIVLGGTWTAYTENYQRWFIKECLQAMNDFGFHDQTKAREKKYQDWQEKIKKWQEKFKKQPFLTNNAEENRQNFANLQMKGETSQATYNQLINQYYKGPEEAVGMSAWQVATWQELESVQQKNEMAQSRCVGMVLETRPDEITANATVNLRRLGATKIQIGVQSLDDEVLRLNKRGHDVATTARAFALLRQAGFKIHVHYMANLYGSTPEKDAKDFRKLFADPRFCPDELKIYPCSLISTAALMRYYKQGLWHPYSEEELLDLSVKMLTQVPEYCRVTRMIRDIPSQDIVVGNKKSNFRQIAMDQIQKSKLAIVEIRSREIRNEKFHSDEVKLRIKSYETSVSQEKFFQFVVPVEKDGQKTERILAFLRLSLAKPLENPVAELLPELKNAALIREIHVYGRALGIGQENDRQAQHFGFGKRLIAEAQRLAAKAGFKKLAVISAIGTREYYRQRGFEDAGLYQCFDLSN
jgi:elongator complex protein 3